MKKFISAVLAVMMIICCVPVYAMESTDDNALTPASEISGVENNESTEGYDSTESGWLNNDTDVSTISDQTQIADGFIAPLEHPDLGASKITTAEELSAMKDDMYGSYVLMNDIDMSAYGDWTPIGTSLRNPFRGTFDGQGHKISGLKVSSGLTSGTLIPSSQAVGLFGVCNGAQIKNVFLEGVQISVSNSSGYTYEATKIDRGSVYAGSIVGYATNSTVIYNCHSSGSISAQVSDEADGSPYAGGLSGFLDTAVISYSYSLCTVGASHSSIMDGNDTFAGGLVGCLNTDGQIDHSYNNGNVTSTIGDFAPSYAGGLVATSNAESLEISNCFNDATVTSRSGVGGIFGGSDSYAGGLVASFGGQIQCSYNGGPVYAQVNDSLGISEGNAYAGGICGEIAASAKIERSVAAHSITSAKAGAKGSGHQYRIAYGNGTKEDNVTVSEVTSGSQNDADIIMSADVLRTIDVYRDELGWDFETIWEMVEGKDFPQLRQAKQIKEKTFAEKYGWPIVNQLESFSYDNDYHIPLKRFVDTFGLSITSLVTYLAVSRFSPWGGNCYGMSLSSVGNAFDYIDIAQLFPETYDRGENLAEYGYHGLNYLSYPTTGNQNFYYLYLDKESEAVEMIERAQLAQHSNEVKPAHVFKGDDRYGELLSYLNSANKNPILVELHSKDKNKKNWNHEVVIDNTALPEEIEDGVFRISIYDPNYPTISEKVKEEFGSVTSWLSGYMYTSYLKINTNTGDWTYCVENSPLNEVSGSYYSKWGKESIVFTDVTKLGSDFFTKTLTLWITRLKILFSSSNLEINNNAGDPLFIVRDNQVVYMSEDCDFNPTISLGGSTILSGSIEIPVNSFDCKLMDGVVSLWSDDYYVINSADGASILKADIDNDSFSVSADDSSDVTLIVQKNNGDAYDALALEGKLVNDEVMIDAGYDKMLLQAENSQTTMDVYVDDSQKDDYKRYGDVPLSDVDYVSPKDEDLVMKDESATPTPTEVPDNRTPAPSGTPNPSTQPESSTKPEPTSDPSAAPEPTPGPESSTTPTSKPTPTTTPSPAPTASPGVAPTATPKPDDYLPVIPGIGSGSGYQPEDEGEYVPGPDEVTNSGFPDVDPNAWYAGPVGWAAQSGVTAGYPDGNFHPDDTCTRAQIVTFLWKAAGTPMSVGTVSFSDVEQGSFYYDAAVWAANSGIIAGYPDGNFHPDDPCTRAQIVAMLYRYANSPAVTGESKFFDIDAGAYYYNAAIWAEQNGIVAGYPDGGFHPNDACTRAQIVTMLYNYIKG